MTRNEVQGELAQRKTWLRAVLIDGSVVMLNPWAGLGLDDCLLEAGGNLVHISVVKALIPY